MLLVKYNIQKARYQILSRLSFTNPAKKHVYTRARAGRGFVEKAKLDLLWVAGLLVNFSFPLDFH